jgi:hypothetical protein
MSIARAELRSRQGQYETMKKKKTEKEQETFTPEKEEACP